MKNIRANAYGTYSKNEDLVPMEIERRKVGDGDVLIDIKYCGICHSDIHISRADWEGVTYPVVPGHEIVGYVSEVGKFVKKFKKGDLVGVGCMVDSCQECSNCSNNEEQHCLNGATFTYNSSDKHLGGHTFGGYSDKIVVDEKFVLHISDKLDIKAVAPLLCAGITTYSPLRQCNVKKGDKVGIVGLGGLGHMAVKLAKAMQAHVVVITTSAKKAKDAMELGADSVIISTDKEEMEKEFNSFETIINTIPKEHDLDPYLCLLKNKGTMVLVGAVEPLKKLNGAILILGGKRILGSLIGGIKETQEMLDFCAEHNIVADVELINIQDVNKAYERVINSDVKYRFVIDMQSLS